VSPVKYELGFYITEDDILHSHCLEPSNFTKEFISNRFTALSKRVGSVKTFRGNGRLRRAPHEMGWSEGIWPAWGQLYAFVADSCEIYTAMKNLGGEERIIDRRRKRAIKESGHR
jgi:hypothetical protein